MLEDERLLGDLLESHCRLSDRLNKLFDERLAGRTLTKKESAFACRILEHILIAEGLAENLGENSEIE